MNSVYFHVTRNRGKDLQADIMDTVFNRCYYYSRALYK